MTLGTFYGVAVGPGDPGWLTARAIEILSRVKKIFVPKAKLKSASTALKIAEPYIPADAQVVELVFPMETDKKVLSRHWRESASIIAQTLEHGEDACFLTLGDALLYSTYIYLLRELRQHLPSVEVITVPGVSAFSAAASLIHFPIGVGKKPVTVIPTSDDLGLLRRALNLGGTVVLMKIGRRLPAILDLLAKEELLDKGVFVSRAGLDNQRIETDLKKLCGESGEAGYLSIILVDAEKEAEVRS